KLRALGVTSAKPLKSLPGVPTLASALKNDLYIQESWWGLWAPAKTPAEVQKIMHAATTKVLNDPEFQQQAEAQGGEVAFSESPAQYAAFVKSEDAKWAKILKLTGAKGD